MMAPRMVFLRAPATNDNEVVFRNPARSFNSVSIQSKRLVG
jgi:hypothetical protein